MRNTTNIKLLPLLLLILVFSCTRDEDGGIVRLSKDKFEKEDAKIIGEALKEDLDAYYGEELINPVENIMAQDYLEKLYETILQTPEVEQRIHFDWTISMIQDDESLEMFSIPGGHLYITTGLLKFVEAESQLMMMLAHEVYYSDRLLFIDKLKEQFGGEELGNILLENDDAKVSTMAQYLRDLTIDSDNVTEADEFAINTVCPFRYDTESLNQILSADNNSQLKWVVNRPPTTERVEMLINSSVLCGNQDRQFPERYNYFKNFLLPK